MRISDWSSDVCSSDLGLSGDAYHVTAPHPEGSGGFRSMQMAFKKAGLKPEDVDYINAHGTSTPLGDELELGAVRRLFGSAIANVSMSSTKSAIGHLLGGDRKSTRLNSSH